MINEPKYKSLINYLKKFNKVAIAYSGGLDSTFLLVAAKEALDENVLALTLNAPYIPHREIKEAKEFCKENNIAHKIILNGNLKDLLINPENRCYICKKHVYSVFKEEAIRYGFKTVLDGTNYDDIKDYRPGLAALNELNIKSPLLENKLTKEDIRNFSKMLGLKTYDKPAYACLLTRLPYNVPVSLKNILRIEMAEDILYLLGFREVRVRLHDDLIRIEINKDKLQDIMQESIRTKIIKELKRIGFKYITLDLEGYRTGSFNTNLKKT